MKKIISSPNESQSAELHHPEYEQALTDIATSIQKKPKNFDGDFSKYLVEHSDRLFQDKELPDSIKELYLQRMPGLAKILEKMLSRDKRTLLLDASRESKYDAYRAATERLIESLRDARDQAGITLRPRSLKLFAWCRQELTETRNALTRLLLKSLNHNKEAEHQFELLDDISNLLIFFIGAADDLADTVQDKKMTECVAKIPFCTTSAELAELRETVATYKKGRFLEYFDIVKDIFQDAFIQLENLFGKPHFDQDVKPRFLEIFKTIVGSLEYSVHMNIQPHDDEITVPVIHETLAPNIMVECFRYLEQALVIKIAQEKGVTLPQQEDLLILNAVISRSQRNAASSNAAATVSRELRENDLSSPFPFDIDATYRALLDQKGTTFVKEFEAFIKDQGYRNGFFETYFEQKPGSDFDYLSLLTLRRTIYRNVVIEVQMFEADGVDIPKTDYSLDSLAEEAIKFAKTSKDERLHNGEMLEKYKRHVELIDKFTDKLALETNVYHRFFEGWQKEISEMKTQCEAIQHPELKKEAIAYVDSWVDFLCTCLFFKHSFDDTI